MVNGVLNDYHPKYSSTEIFEHLLTVQSSIKDAKYNAFGAVFCAFYFWGRNF